MSSEYVEYIERDGVQIQKPQTKVIWRTFWILLLITLAEFAVAFGLPHRFHMLKVAIFVGMTIVKAAYIIGEFMHLKHEVKSLLWTILVPIIFIVWLILALLIEGGYMGTVFGL